MHAKDLIGKKSIRYVPSVKGDRSYMSGVGCDILNVTDTHVYIRSGEGSPFALGEEFLDGWVEFEAYPEGKSELPENKPAWDAICPKCDCTTLEIVPDSMVLTSDPPLYRVKCVLCGTELNARRRSHVEAFQARQGIQWTVGETGSTTIVNRRGVETGA